MVIKFEKIVFFLWNYDYRTGYGLELPEWTLNNNTPDCKHFPRGNRELLEIVTVSILGHSHAPFCNKLADSL